MKHDILILGAGGAGLFCAAEAARRGRDVLVLDHAKKLGGKILISGGGRCNFTNLGAGPANYVSRNPHFCKSALSRYPSQKFIELVQAHAIPFHEKKLGQLFCDDSAQRIVDLLRSECDDAGAKILLETKVESIVKTDTGFEVATSAGTIECTSLVIATGGLSIPKIGATDLGYRIAEQFGLKLVPRDPALDGFVFGPDEQRNFGDLAGISIDCVMSAGGKSFRENLLFTHSGLSGPASLQASLHWHPGDAVTIDLVPERDLAQWFRALKQQGDRRIVKNLLAEVLPSRFADRFAQLHFPSESPLPQVSEKALEEFCARLKAWTLVPERTVGYRKAEVTRGGVDTDELSSKTMEARKVPGLYFIGEVVDVTGWLGGYNFQWAWASGWAAGQAV